MKKLLKVIINKFIDYKLKVKFTILFIFSFTFLFIFSILLFQNSFSNYNKNLYEVLANVLDLSSNKIEDKLEKLVDKSYEIITDSKIQEYLEIINNHSDYQRFKYSTELGETLDEILFYDNSISSVHIIYNNLEQNYIAKDMFKFDNSTIASICDEAEKFSGQVFWMDPTEGNSCIVLARQIRSTKNLSLQPLGTLILRINPKQLVQDTENENIDNNIIIMGNHKFIYQPNQNLSYASISNDIHDFSTYHVKKINGHKYFLVYKESKFSDWFFVNYVLYDDVVKNIITTKNFFIIIYIIVTIFIIWLINLLLQGILKPVESLTQKMRIVEQGNFNIIQPHELHALKSGDEIGYLEYDFHIMISKINDLINENYKKQLDIKKFQFQALQAQINPHFLYNTLDSIFWLAKINNQPKISSMIKSLANLLRKSISDNTNVISIEQELALLYDYINIQKFRYEERLQIEIKVDDSIKKCLIPKLTIQPLVENSISYGLELKPEICHITIYSDLSEDSFHLLIEDNGCGMSQDFIQQLSTGLIKPQGSGIGIKNINDRIRNMFGQEYGLTFKSTLNKGTTVVIRMPYTEDMN